MDEPKDSKPQKSESALDPSAFISKLKTLKKEVAALFVKQDMIEKACSHPTVLEQIDYLALHTLANQNEWEGAVYVSEGFFSAASKSTYKSQLAPQVELAREQAQHVRLLSYVKSPTPDKETAYLNKRATRLNVVRGIAYSQGMFVLEHWVRYSSIYLPMLEPLCLCGATEIEKEEELAREKLKHLLATGAEQTKLEMAEEKERQKIWEEYLQESLPFLEQAEGLWRQAIDHWVHFDCSERYEDYSTVLLACNITPSEESALPTTQRLRILQFIEEDQRRILDTREEVRAWKQLMLEAKKGSTAAVLAAMEDDETEERQIVIYDELTEALAIFSAYSDGAVEALRATEAGEYSSLMTAFAKGSAEQAMEACEGKEANERADIVYQVWQGMVKYANEFEDTLRAQQEHEAWEGLKELCATQQQAQEDVLLGEERNAWGEMMAQWATVNIGAAQKVLSGEEEEERERLAYKMLGAMRAAVELGGDSFVEALEAEEERVRKNLKATMAMEGSYAAVSGLESAQTAKRQGIQQLENGERITVCLSLEENMRETIWTQMNIESSLDFVRLEDDIRKAINRREHRSFLTIMQENLAESMKQEVEMIVTREKKQRRALTEVESGRALVSMDRGEEMLREGLEAQERREYETFLQRTRDAMFLGAREAFETDAYGVFLDTVWGANCRGRRTIVEEQEDEQRWSIHFSEEGEARKNVLLLSFESALRGSIEHLEEEIYHHQREEYQRTIYFEFTFEIVTKERTLRTAYEAEQDRYWLNTLEDEYEYECREDILRTEASEYADWKEQFQAGSANKEFRQISLIETVSRHKVWNEQLQVRASKWAEYESLQRAAMLEEYVTIGQQIIHTKSEQFLRAFTAYENERWEYLMYRFNDSGEVLKMDLLIGAEAGGRRSVWKEKHREMADIITEEESFRRREMETNALQRLNAIVANFEDSTSSLLFDDFFGHEEWTRGHSWKTQCDRRLTFLTEAADNFRLICIAEERRARIELCAALEDQGRMAILRTEEREMGKMAYGSSSTAFEKQVDELLAAEKRQRYQVLMQEQRQEMAEFLAEYETAIRQLIYERAEEQSFQKMRGQYVVSSFDLLSVSIQHSEKRERGRLIRSSINEQLEQTREFYEMCRVLIDKDESESRVDLFFSIESSRRNALAENENSSWMETVDLFAVEKRRLLNEGLETREQRARVFLQKEWAKDTTPIIIEMEESRRHVFLDEENAFRSGTTSEAFTSAWERERQSVAATELLERGTIDQHQNQVQHHMAREYALQTLKVTVDDVQQNEFFFMVTTFWMEHVLEAEVFRPEREKFHALWDRFISDGFPMLADVIFKKENYARREVIRQYVLERSELVATAEQEGRHFIRAAESRERGFYFGEDTQQGTWNVLLGCIEGAERTARAVVFHRQKAERIYHVCDQEADLRRVTLVDAFFDERLNYLFLRMEWERRKILENEEATTRKAMITEVTTQSGALLRSDLEYRESYYRQLIHDEWLVIGWGVRTSTRMRWTTDLEEEDGVQEEGIASDGESQDEEEQEEEEEAGEAQKKPLGAEAASDVNAFKLALEAKRKMHERGAEAKAKAREEELEGVAWEDRPRKLVERGSIVFGSCFKFGLEGKRVAITRWAGREWKDLQQWFIQNIVFSKHSIALQKGEKKKRGVVLQAAAKARFEIGEEYYYNIREQEEYEESQLQVLLFNEYEAVRRAVVADLEKQQRASLKRGVAAINVTYGTVGLQQTELRDRGRIMQEADEFFLFKAIVEHEEPGERQVIWEEYLVYFKDLVQELWRKRNRAELRRLEKEETLTRKELRKGRNEILREEVIMRFLEPVGRRRLIAEDFCAPLLETYLPRWEKWTRAKWGEQEAKEIGWIFYDARLFLNDRRREEVEFKQEPKARLVVYEEEAETRTGLITHLEPGWRQLIETQWWYTYRTEFIPAYATERFLIQQKDLFTREATGRHSVVAAQLSLRLGVLWFVHEQI